MKRLSILMVLLIVITALCYSAPVSREILDEHDDHIEVNFTSYIKYNIGFSRVFVSGSMKPTSDGFDEDEHNEEGEPVITFVPDADTGGYTTDSFYFYAQVFTTDPMEFFISSATPLKSADGQTVVQYENTAYETASVFSGSGATDAVLVSENNTEADRLKPRPYSRRICLVATDVDSIIGAAGDLTAEITVTARVKT